MKNLLAILLLAAPLAAQTAQTAPASPPPSAAPAVGQQGDKNAQRAREILNQAIAALGGAAFLNYTDYQQQGRTHSFYNGAPRGVGVPFVRSVKLPDREKVELFKERDWIILHAGDQGWDTTFRGTRTEDPSETEAFIRRRDHSLESVLRQWINEPASMLFYDGVALANTRQTHKVTVMNLKNQSVTLFIDVNNSLPVQKTFIYRDPETRERVEEGDIYDMYRPVQGIQTPFNLTRTINGQMAAQRFLYEVKYNLGFTEADFTAPKVTFDPKKRSAPIEGPPR